MRIETIVVGPLQNNCYLVYDEASRAGILIDPGDEPEKILRVVEDARVKVDTLLCTHAHFDHIGALADLKASTGGRVVLHPGDLPIYGSARHHAALWGFRVVQPPPPDLLINEGEPVSAGALSFTVWSTPGHSPGGICLYGHGALFSGDTVFAGSVGRTDLPGGDINALKRSFARVIALPPDTAIYPGHGPATTVADEREYNFFVHQI